MEQAEVTKAIMEIKEQLATLFEQNRATWKRIDEQKSVAESVHSIALSVERQTVQLERLAKIQDEMRRELDEIKSEPRKRWNDVVKTAITVVVSAVIGYFLSKTGLK